MKTITISSVTVGGGGTTVSASGAIAADSAVTIPAQVVTINCGAEGLPTWIRQFRMTSTGLLVKRYGVAPVKIPLASLAKLASEVENGLTFAPTIIINTANKTYDSTDPGTMEVSWVSELATSVNKWQYAEWNSGTSSYEAWADVTSPSETNVTTAGITLSTLSFTAGSGIYLDKTKFRKVITNPVGTLTTGEGILTVV